ncbi:alpha-E domain-containing protein [Polaromonas sp.]|uniref:alpha-E domain-containing protein n=1 Tax=Polaromonas sp. TaxID=1869339 RepID=UPI00345A43E3
MLSRTADHLFWMSRYTERAGDMPQAFAGMTDKCAQRLSWHHQNTQGAPALSVFEARS